MVWYTTGMGTLGLQREEGSVQNELVATWLLVDGIPHITVVGEINVSTAPILDEALCEARHDDPFCVVLSLEACSYCDSRGLSVLLRHARKTPRFVVISPDGSGVRKLLRITRTDQTFEVVGSADEARLQLTP
ncbi:MAG: STAS domain-containing protein [Candidatus Eremiobacteraeota bacterium]|nr:STAS domain-containing protein [Candidatus Eremiobacteraeota bacterium]